MARFPTEAEARRKETTLGQREAAAPMFCWLLAHPTQLHHARSGSQLSVVCQSSSRGTTLSPRHGSVDSKAQGPNASILTNCAKRSASALVRSVGMLRIVTTVPGRTGNEDWKPAALRPVTGIDA